MMEIEENNEHRGNGFLEAKNNLTKSTECNILELKQRLKVLQKETNLESNVFWDDIHFCSDIEQLRQITFLLYRQLEIVKIQSKIAKLSKEGESKDLQPQKSTKSTDRELMELLESELGCSICFEISSEPTLLECGHSLCSFCTNNSEIDVQRKCTICTSQFEQDVLKRLEIPDFVVKEESLLPFKIQKMNQQTFEKKINLSTVSILTACDDRSQFFAERTKEAKNAKNNCHLIEQTPIINSRKIPNEIPQTDRVLNFETIEYTNQAVLDRLRRRLGAYREMHDEKFLRLKRI